MDQELQGLRATTDLQDLREPKECREKEVYKGARDPVETQERKGPRDLVVWLEIMDPLEDQELLGHQEKLDLRASQEMQAPQGTRVQRGETDLTAEMERGERGEKSDLLVLQEYRANQDRQETED